MTDRLARSLVSPALVVATVIVVAGFATAAERPDLIMADFEAPTYGAWVATGTAFGRGPARGSLPNQQPVTGFLGFGLVNSYLGGDAATGTLTSPEFRIERPRLNLLVGGGNHPGKTCVNLLVDGRIERTVTGADAEPLRWHSWEVAALEGRRATLQIVDEVTGGWGHINVDEIVQSDTPPRVVDDRELALLRAMSSVQNAAERAAVDPARPRFHFRPPANWMNDPNGPIQFDGWHHIFYQQNPYGDAWENMHWGHARSRDLVTWEHLPIALWPSQALGERHVFSGCATTNAAGQPMIFYTSIGGSEPQCWIAVPEDRDLLRWRKHPANPVLTEKTPGIPYFDFRDPFVFRDAGRVFMVHGGNLNRGQGGQAVVSLYEAQNPDLTQWSYRGILFTHPDPKVANIECPLFFPLGDRFVLITSPHRSPDWFIGTFDPASGRFTAEREGIVDQGNFYAPNAFFDEQGRGLLWGWVNGFKSGKGWNGCLTLPRVLTLVDGRLRQAPAVEVETLRVRGVALDPVRLCNASQIIPPERLRGDMIEWRVTLTLNGASSAGLRVHRSADGTRGVNLDFDGTHLQVGDTRVPLGEARASLKLHLFLDRSLLEVFADDGRVCVTKVIGFSDADSGLEFYARGGEAVFGADAWELRPTW